MCPGELATTFVTQMMFVCWRDKKCVTVLSNVYPGHSDVSVSRRGRNHQSGEYETMDLPLPSPIEYYNRFMGGVDMLDQLISYHRILRQTKNYYTNCSHCGRLW